MASPSKTQEEQTLRVDPAEDFQRAGSRERSPTPTVTKDTQLQRSPEAKSSQSTENRLRPVADIVNRLIWDEKYDSTDYIIGYEDRFDGRMEASLNSWKRESTDEEFIPQHRVLYIKRKSDSEIKAPSSLRDLVFKPVSDSSSPRITPLLPSFRIPPCVRGGDPSAEQQVEPHTSETVHVPRGQGRRRLPSPELTRSALKGGRSVRVARRSTSDEEPLTRTKSQYFEDVFNTRGPRLSPTTRISQDSLVMIEIKVNVKIKDEDSVVPSVMSRMAQIYQKSESFMVVTVQQDACLRFGHSTLPAYSMKVFALPYLIAPITNLRSTILIQAAIQEILHISPSRGVILYIPIAEENMATNNTTMMGEIARLERETHGQETGVLKSLSRTMSRRMKSTSSQSRPLSVATTSSWTVESDSQEAKRDMPTGSEGTNASKEGSAARSGRASRRLHQFISRRVPETFEGPSNDE
ncbi:hypothetical protein ARAM_004859 [Aspergillus rambellii]|uniref:L-dopachrome isomerase n=1 Tax=Aspergillus rambellii TaxID=308745 RepID=A0A0F8TY22_9EURO|nr:hypothetical protein ARAM_004859 [Aspergillus rambellii]